MSEGEPDQHLHVRTVDRDVEELQLPRVLIAKALRFLAAARPEPVRIVVRGRTGSGRHPLLTTPAWCGTAPFWARLELVSMVGASTVKV